MIDLTLNILGGEWMIIIFVALMLFLGTGQLPGAARKLGRVVNEINKAKAEVQNQIKEVSKEGMDVAGPVENERQKNEIIAKSLGISPAGITDEELQKLIQGRMGHGRDNSENQKKD
ncbi:MAG: twin-arginine translocase TatA/TatE family subunit [Nitrosopumilus sp.]|jgi:sec-independent protein translocase protein TatA|nr:MAG: twin-arginine translocase TatA/TatE family subunit [Nitrosopumilus sp.]HUU48557.1 twin-arginine translocase TatA/TatE family subunit [Nitrosopumilaceae archaeon]